MTTDLDRRQSAPGWASPRIRLVAPWLAGSRAAGQICCHGDPADDRDGSASRQEPTPIHQVSSRRGPDAVRAADFQRLSGEANCKLSNGGFLSRGTDPRLRQRANPDEHRI